MVSCPGTGQDGELQMGLGRAYVDNGDGTITDTRTGLMWEKLSDDGTIHDKDNTYTWADAFAAKMVGLNGGSGFAGHTDWRLPNVNELQSLVSYGASFPAVYPPFYTACVPGCTVLTCSCTFPNVLAYFWSSTTVATDPNGAWYVGFDGGGMAYNNKLNALYVRAVRGGL